MAHTVELEQVGFPLLSGVTVEASHLRAFQVVGGLGGFNQPAPSDVIDFAQPFSVALELEFGGPGAGVAIPALSFTIRYFFSSLNGVTPQNANVTTPVIATVANTFHYSAQAPAGSLTRFNVPAGTLGTNGIYKVSAIVTVGLVGSPTTLFRGFIEGSAIAG